MIIEFFKKIKTKIGDFSGDHPIGIVLIVAMISVFIVSALSLQYWLSDFDGFFENVLVEAHGMIFDLFVIGAFVLWLNKLGERKREVNRYREELEDYKGWYSIEASHRVAGIVRRLIKKDVKKIKIQHHALVRANLQDLNLEEAVFSQSILEEAKFNRSKLKRAYFGGSNLGKVNFNSADLSDTYLRGVHLVDADMAGSNLENSNLFRANINGVIFTGANLKRANLREIKLKRDQWERAFSKAYTLYEAELDEQLREYIERNYPHLFEEPEMSFQEYKIERTNLHLRNA